MNILHYAAEILIHSIPIYYNTRIPADICMLYI